MGEVDRRVQYFRMIYLMMHMKILVVGHSDINSTYGAATSIRNHFKCFVEEKSVSFLHIYRKGVFLKKQQENFVALSNMDDLRKIWLPIDTRAYAHSSPGLLKEIYGTIFPNLMAKIFKRRLIFYLESSGADVIHLNSVVLWPMVDIIKDIPSLCNAKIIMHVREMWDANGIAYATRSLSKVDSFIFIDDAVKNTMLQYFPSLKKIHTNVVQNPFKSNERVDKKIVGMLSGKYFNFAVTGIIGEDKGVGFICKVYSQYRPPNSQLFVIGKENSLSRKLKKKYGRNGINFTGEIEKLGERGAFNYIDCVIRGETEFCTGRSTYEALYAGGFAIIPGKSSNVVEDKQLSKFKNNIFCYEPRSEISLGAILNVSAKKIFEKKLLKEDRSFSSNYPCYKVQMMKIYEHCKEN